jgi:hypothetical protein
MWLLLQSDSEVFALGFHYQGNLSSRRWVDDTLCQGCFGFFESRLHPGCPQSDGLGLPFSWSVSGLRMWAVASTKRR